MDPGPPVSPHAPWPLDPGNLSAAVPPQQNVRSAGAADPEAATPTPEQHTAGYALRKALALRGWRYETFMEAAGEYLMILLPGAERICVSGTTRDGRDVSLGHPTHEHASWQALLLTGTAGRPEPVYDSDHQAPAPFGGDTAALVTAIAVTARGRASPRGR